MVDNHLVEKSHRKEIAYLSAEFLIGPQLSNNLLNLDIRKEAAEAVGKYGYTLDEILELSVEPGLVMVVWVDLLLVHGIIGNLESSSNWIWYQI